VVDVIRRNQLRDAESQAEAIIKHAFDFADGFLHDDVAALVVKVAAPAGP
jgi:hypothetical protein